MSSDFLTQQGFPAGELAGMVALLIAMGICALVARAHSARSHRRRQPAEFEVSAYRATCDVTGCGYPATQWRERPMPTGPSELRHVCVGCANEGDAFKWWHPTGERQETPFDRELADLDDIETYANGGDAA